MKWLIVNTDYPDFLEQLYKSNPSLTLASFAEQQEVRFASLFGLADFYPRALQPLGHDATEVFINNEAMQRQWCIEHGVPLPQSQPRHFRMRRGIVPWVSRRRCNEWQSAALISQVERMKPDVVLNRNMCLPTVVLRAIRAKVKLLIGQHAATRLPYDIDWSLYDLVVSSFPATIDWFRRRGIRAAYIKLAFDLAVLDRVPTSANKKYPLTFVGSLHPVHSTRLQLLETLCEVFDDFLLWTSDIREVPNDSPLHDRYMGPAWGSQMYRILAESEITVNEHGAIPPYANNYRLYEATGMGACLLTDWKENLCEMFVPGQEVATYTTPSDCIDQVNCLRADRSRLQQIASFGRRRTMSEHTTVERVKELLEHMSTL